MLKEVNKKEFFEVIGPLDVNPYPQGRYDDLGGYRNLWKLRNGTLVGVSEPKTYGSQEQKYFLNR